MSSLCRVFLRNRTMSRTLLAACCLGILFCAGCIDSSKSQPAANKPDDKGIFGKKTQDIGEFDKDKANQVRSDQSIHASDPVTAPLSVYGPAMERISLTHVTHAIELFNASEGRYPKDHEEFMQRIIKENNIQLPVLPYKGQYKYDVEKHELVVVRSIEDAEKAKE